MFFVGIDLAWSWRNSSGIAIIEGQRDSATFTRGTGEIREDNEIVDYIITSTRGKPALIAVDASLIVNNNTGERNVETQLKKMFAPYHAVPYPSNRSLYNRLYGGLRGERMAKMLEEKGFRHDPFVKRFEPGKKFFEVFPHSAAVVIFKLKHTLKYKAGKNRDYMFRWQEFAKYQGYLKSLKNREPSLTLPRYILETDVRELKGKALKRYEDLLDAIFCAYIAFYYWYEPGRCSVIGDLSEGYMVTPVFDVPAPIDSP